MYSSVFILFQKKEPCFKTEISFSLVDFSPIYESSQAVQSTETTTYRVPHLKI